MEGVCWRWAFGFIVKTQVFDSETFDALNIEASWGKLRQRMSPTWKTFPLYFIPVGFPSAQSQIKRLDFIYDFMVLTVSGPPRRWPSEDDRGVRHTSPGGAALAVEE